MAVREARPDDLTQLVAMAQGFVEETDMASLAPFDLESSLAAMTGLMERPEAVLLIDPGAGMLGGFLAPLIFNRGTIMAQEVFWWVEHDKRGSGTAGDLISAFEAWASENGAAAITMLALEANTPERVAKMYDKHGYEPLERAFIKRTG